MIIVTGGAGFIGSNLIHGLNAAGRDDILVVDDLTDGRKFRNISAARIMDYQDMEEFRSAVQDNRTFEQKIDAVFHQGACSVTTEWDGRYMLDNNYEYSKLLLHYCLDNQIPFIYASSASVYGVNRESAESGGHEAPINVYGYSKFLFDNYVRRVVLSRTVQSQVVGLRYFNVFGPREQHKEAMASVVYHFNQQIQKTGRLRLFRGSDGYADGEQRRDFIHVDDVVAVNLWFMQQQNKSGIYNTGTGQSRSFNDMARAVIQWHGRGNIEYIDFPQQLIGSYQSFTEADISALRKAGYQQPFRTLEEGITRYLQWLNH